MSKDTFILGINSVYHEPAACLLKNGEVLFAIEEERLNRVRHGKSALITNPHQLPFLAISECLDFANISFKEINHIGFSFDPIQRLTRNIDQNGNVIEGDWGSLSGESKYYKLVNSIPEILEDKYGVDLRNKWHWIPHHVCHAASAYFVSPFEDSAVLTIDGIGEYYSRMFANGSKGLLQILNEKGGYPNSLGFLWTKASRFLGALVDGMGEYGAGKLMALASYGNPDKYYKEFRSFVYYNNEGDFQINDEIFQFRYETHEEYEKLFGFKARKENEEFSQDHMDFAAAMQKLTNEIVLIWANKLHDLTGSDNLCMAGGVTLNCTTNAYILENSKFKNIFIQPAANDMGTALGAALYVDKHIVGNNNKQKQFTPYLGSQFDNNQISKYLANCDEIQFIQIENIDTITADLLTKGAIIAWYQGRMEFGPRALGNRSILADPRRSDILKRLSQDIKGRKWFRPLAPSVLESEVDNWFVRPKGGAESDKWMLFSYRIKPEKIGKIPAVTHYDNTGRVQVVSENLNKPFHNLLKEFYRLTKVPILVNTSFNIKQPIVNSPQHALENFLSSGNGKIDFLVMNNYLIARKGEHDLELISRMNLSFQTVSEHLR